MDRRAELRDFLRSRRDRLTPAEVGLPDYGARRRVAGLRREEVAQLAGISSDYYVRLEQGRNQHVSTAVIDAVCRVLRLDEHERAHLYNLARPKDRRQAPRPQRLRPTLRAMVQAIEGGPAYLLGRRMDVLAMNPMAELVFSGLAELPDGRRNLPRFVFLDPSAPELFVDWSVAARSAAAYLRLDSGRYPEDTELAALIGELSIKNEQFRQLWTEHPVADRTYGLKRLRHPLVGDLSLHYETLRCADEDQLLVMFHATEEATRTSLQLLGNWGSTTPAVSRVISHPQE